MFYKKLFICDIITNGANGKLNVSGIVVGKRITNKGPKLYQIDDGTGMIECFEFANDALLTPIQLEAIETNELLLRVKDSSELNIGDFVAVFGTHKTFNGKIQINVHFIHNAPDVNTETQIILETLFNNKK